MRAYVVEQVQGAFREVDLPSPVPGPGRNDDRSDKARSPGKKHTHAVFSFRSVRVANPQPQLVTQSSQQRLTNGCAPAKTELFSVFVD